MCSIGRKSNVAVQDSFTQLFGQLHGLSSRIHKLSATRRTCGGKGKRRVWKGPQSGGKMGMKYRQLDGEERSVLAALRLVGLKPAEIARELGRHRSTVSRELKRNAAPYDGWYRAQRAQQRAHARRYRSRRNSQFGRGQWERVQG